MVVPGAVARAPAAARAMAAMPASARRVAARAVVAMPGTVRVTVRRHHGLMVVTVVGWCWGRVVVVGFGFRLGGFVVGVGLGFRGVGSCLWVAGVVCPGLGLA